MSNFTNSPLVSYTRISPNKNSPRNQDKITMIIVHHMAGVASVESFGELVSKPARQMSANYAIGNDGRIGLYCEEKDRCWCSSSAWADNRGIAIEVSNSKLGEPWPISTKAWNALVELCADICKRNDIPKLVYTGDKTGSLCFHRFFAATGCVPVDTTELLTEKGWQYLRDLNIGDKVATVSPNEFRIKFNPIENMVEPKMDTVYHVGDMTITRDHRVLHNNQHLTGYGLKQYQQICDEPFVVPAAGYASFSGLNISSSEMVFLLEAQRIGTLTDRGKVVEFRYISENKVGYFDTLVKNCKFEFTRSQDDLGPVVFRVTDTRAVMLVKHFLSERDFTWEWLQMNPTQFSYFIYKITTHENGTWNRHYRSESNVNIDIVQAICALNQRATKYDPNDGVLYISDTGYRQVDPKESHAEENVKVSCVTVKGECFLMRQNGTTTLTGNCPGEYIFSRAQKLCDEVNARLTELRGEEIQEALKEQAKQKETAKQEEKPSEVIPVTLKAGVLVSIQPNATYYNGAAIPQWVKNQRWYVMSISGDRAVINKNESNNAAIESPINVKYLTVVQNAGAPVEKTFEPYIIPLSAGTQIYQLVGDKLYAKERIKISSKYTIVQETVVLGTKMGYLKSGAGWVKLGTSNDTDTTINPGDTVEVLSNKTYDGKTFTIYEKQYKVLRVNGDRVVISSDGKNVTAAVKASNLRKK